MVSRRFLRRRKEEEEDIQARKATDMFNAKGFLRRRRRRRSRRDENFRDAEADAAMPRHDVYDRKSRENMATSASKWPFSHIDLLVI